VAVIDAKGATHNVVSGYAAVSDPQLVQKPGGTIYLYFGGSTPDPKTVGALRRRARFCSPPRRNADFLAGRDRLRHVYQGDNGETLRDGRTRRHLSSSGEAAEPEWRLRTRGRRFDRHLRAVANLSVVAGRMRSTARAWCLASRSRSSG
jgi:hypothetical protein